MAALLLAMCVPFLLHARQARYYPLVALFTTIAGAVAGANLALIGLDIAWDRQPRARVEAKETLEARPVVG